MLEEHLGYLADSKRLDCYRAAIARAVQPGDIVADVGCGTGVLGLLCLQAGASRVIAIDSTPIIEVARETFVRANFAERTDFILGKSYRVDLPSQADIVVCDHVGYFGFDYGIIELMQDARNRFLKPGGRLIPSRVRPMLGAVQSEAARAKADGWAAKAVPHAYNWLCTYSANAKHSAELTAADLLGPPSALGWVDLAAYAPDLLSWTTELACERDGVLHGLAGWFECELFDGVTMTNSPLAAEPIQRPQVFLPIEEPVPIQAGSRLKVTVTARPSDNLLTWIVEMPSCGRRFTHSTWKGLVMGTRDLLRANPSRIPVPNLAARARNIVLEYCDGERSVRDIEETVLLEHPNLFPSRAEAARFIAEVLARDTE